MGRRLLRRLTPRPANPMQLAPHPLSSRRAFTLVEVLTVVAVIGILAAILIPVVGKVRESARASRCVANLRTLASAHAMYRADFKGESPPGTANNTHPLSEGHNVFGVQLLRRYYKPGPNYIFSYSPTTFLVEPTELCPSAAPTQTQSNQTSPERGPDYGMLSRTERYDTFYAAPARTPLFWDGWNAVWNSTRRMPPRHGGRNGINVAFLDGHVEYIAASDPRLFVSWWASATTQPSPASSTLGQGGSLLSATYTP